MSDLTLGSLFDGSGGFPLAGILAGIKPIWGAEIEPFPIRVTEKHIPDMLHFGDVTKLEGSKLPPVDIITFGSPCQDMSIAGKREGLLGMRSGLFFEAIRIIKEMRSVSNGKYPRYIVWENVPGAFSSRKGDDFRNVLEEICKIADSNIRVPESKKWQRAGYILGNGFSIAWRTFNARYWGVPQRRKRIFLVTDFNSECAGKILFESEGLSGYSAESFRAWQRFAENFGNSSKRASRTDFIMKSYGFCSEHSAQTSGIGYEEEISPTLRAGTVPAVLAFENHGQDARYNQLSETAPAVSATYGNGGNNQPLVVDCYDIRFTSEGTKNYRANVYKTEISRTIDCGGNAPDANQGGVAVVQGSMIGRKESNGPQGSGIAQNVSFTLNTTDRHAVAYGIDRAAFNQGKNAQYDFAINDESQPTIVAKGPGAVAVPIYSSSHNSMFTRASKETAGTLTATDYKSPPIINDIDYVVRRLTPTECARLQGFPDWWCDDLGEEMPTSSEIERWRLIFEEYGAAVSRKTKHKTDKQITNWLKNPHSDSAEYKLWGNGVALPCVLFVLSGIVWCNSNNNSETYLCENCIDKSSVKS